MAAKLFILLIKSAELFGALPPNPQEGLCLPAGGLLSPRPSSLSLQCSLKIATLAISILLARVHAIEAYAVRKG